MRRKLGCTTTDLVAQLSRHATALPGARWRVRCTSRLPQKQSASCTGCSGAQGAERRGTAAQKVRDVRGQQRGSIGGPESNCFAGRSPQGFGPRACTNFSHLHALRHPPETHKHQHQPDNGDIFGERPPWPRQPVRLATGAAGALGRLAALLDSSVLGGTLLGGGGRGCLLCSGP